MSYYLDVKLRAAPVVVDSGIDALWPDDDSVSFAGHTEAMTLDRDVVQLRFYRELEDDVDVVAHKAEMLRLTLREALLEELRLEFGEYASRLAGAGLSFMEASFSDHLTERQRDTLRQAEEAWAAKRQEDIAQAQEKADAERAEADLLGYARTLARMGCAAEHGWPDAVTRAYDDQVNRELSRRLARLAAMDTENMGRPTQRKAIAEALREAAAYSERVTGGRQ